MRQEQRFTLLLTTGYLLLAGIIYALLMHEFRLDDSFITYRYARNVADGIGLVYNPGENILSTTAPLYALSLAALSFIISDFHLLGGLFGTVCIAAGGVCITLLLKNLPRWIRAWSGLVYVCATPLWLALGMETPLWIMLVMLAVLLADDERWIFAGGCTGLAMLSRPDVALPGALLGLLALVISIQKRKWQPVIFYGLAAALPVIVFYGWAWCVYGSPFPATLSAKSAQAIVGVTGFGEFTTVLEGLTRILDDLLRQSPLYLITAILLIAGVLKRWRTPVLMVILWGVLHLLAYILLNTAPYRWYYLPLLPGIILLAAHGLTIISEKIALPAAIALAITLPAAQLTSFLHLHNCFTEGCSPGAASPTVDWLAYRETGEWLNANTPEDALIGVSEVGQIGFYAQRTMTDYLGLLQPKVAQLLKRDDLYSWLAGYAPDYLVFQRYGGGEGLRLYNDYIQDDPWLNAAYTEVASFDDPRYFAAPVAIYERTVPDQALRTHIAKTPMGGMLLEAFALPEDLKSGEALRIRLDWTLLRDDLPAELQITVALVDTEARFDRAYVTQYWHGAWSTWHTLVLPDDLAAGEYDLDVTLWTQDGAAVNEKIYTVNVRKPTANPASNN